MGKISLAHMKGNQKGKVFDIAGGEALHQRLAHIGVYKGKEITKINHVGLKGPVVVRVGRSILAVGHTIATKIMVDIS
jgi:ferrous iron transport protein A